MLLQTVRPNIVQSIRAYRVEDLMQAAEAAGQHFLYANLTTAQSKQEVLESIAQAFMFPVHFGKNLDALYDCMTDLVHKSGSQPGFVVVLEQLPDNPRFDPSTVLLPNTKRVRWVRCRKYWQVVLLFYQYFRHFC